MSDDGYEHAEVLSPAIQEVVNQHSDDHGVVTKYIMVVEVMDPDGLKNLQLYRGPGESSCTVWEARGMLYELLMTKDLFGD